MFYNIGPRIVSDDVENGFLVVKKHSSFIAQKWKYENFYFNVAASFHEQALIERDKSWAQISILEVAAYIAPVCNQTA